MEPALERDYMATIIVEIVGGKLNIRANVPDATTDDERVAAALAVELMAGAKSIMDKALNQNQPIQRGYAQ